MGFHLIYTLERMQQKKHMQFISKLFGFNLPCSESSIGIIALYVELCLYSFLILYVIIDIICGIVIEFKEPYFEGKKKS